MIKVKMTNNFSINNRSVFYIFKTNLLFTLILVLFMGCKPSGELQIQFGYFIDGVECKQIEATVLKISSEEDFNAFIGQCTNKDIVNTLNKNKTTDWNTGFIYLTKNYTLTEIKKNRNMKVQAAILKKSEKGIGIYLINGDSHIPLKVTENIKPNKKNSD